MLQMEKNSWRFFNSGEDYKFQEISIRNTQKQIEIANLKDGIWNLKVILLFHKMQ